MLLFGIQTQGSHCDNILVGVLYELLVGELVHSDKEWWYFEGGTWQKDGGFLHDEIPKDDIPINDIVRYLGSCITTMRLMKALSYELGDPKFVGKLNSNAGLLGMKNGTYELNSKSFRKAIYSDHISLSCGVKYKKKYKDEDLVEFMKILKQIFPRDDVLDFFIRTSCLSTSLITGKRANSSDATPDIQYAKNKLAVFLQEPNPEEKIQFRAKIVVVANNALEVPVVNMFFSEDVEMEENIFKYREIFMAMMLDEYSRFVKEGLNIPQYIKDKTSEYITLNNYMLKYIRTELLYKPGKNLLASDLYDSFKEWFWQSCPELRNEGYEEEHGIVMNIKHV
ncbi:hypothetical protein JB92DRAFT_2835882 [Gautieria morchelliformis]|nr:hypothetical protein JB92DRAFT_2835882 [Gautieria morchelliformis]